jgi:hydrogenase nickel incorporation protein HypB
MSSPGAGKTSLLERTISALKEDLRIGVIEGDIQSSQDAERIARTGIPVVQINTGGACHLDGNMIRDTLVCPAEFKVGEDFKAMILSVTEGDDKPAKYPLMFHESSVLLINKIDLLPYVDCSVEKIRDDSLKINPNLAIFEISCKTGEGIENWYSWVRERAKDKEASQ